MSKINWHSVLCDGRCIHWFYSYENALHYVRRKLSGPMHQHHKQQVWKIIRGRV